MRNNFNLIAKSYDFVVQVVFGGEVKKSYTYFLDQILSSDKVLIVGGGAGQLLDHLPRNCEVDYVDQSRQMIRLAKKHRKQYIRFFELDFFDFNGNKAYDWILFPYFLDLFSDEEVRKIFDQASPLLKQNGSLLIADFALPKTRFQKLLIAVIIKCLRPLVQLQITKLPSIQSVLMDKGYECLSLEDWSDGFIFSGIYRQRETF